MTSKPTQNNQLGIKFLLTTFSLTLVIGLLEYVCQKSTTRSEWIQSGYNER